MIKRGRIVIRLDNVQVAEPPADVKAKVVAGFRNMDGEQLVWILSVLAYELNRRSMAVTD